jgi:Short C-terminal domain
MDFRKRDVDFQEADRRYAELARQRDAGTISDEEFDAKRQQLMVQDGEGRWWAKVGEPEEWYYRDGSAWVRGTPPGYREATHEPATDSPTAQTPSPPRGAEGGIAGRQGMPSWIPVAGLGGIALVGIVLVFWVLVPYLRGEPAPGKQGETMSVKQSESAPIRQGESTPADGAAFDAVFVHRATPENLSENSTYLDNPLANGDPNVVLYVTQNWNPDGSTGTYNEHPIGVWYDDSRQRWAIFNQDRETMPDGAAFNVAVLGAR